MKKDEKNQAEQSPHDKDQQHQEQKNDQQNKDSQNQEQKERFQDINQKIKDNRTKTRKIIKTMLEVTPNQ